ncbi:MAG: transcription initiation factor IIB [Promethearchaeota archaeon]|nr:MAG: transcription initiation factor IIB [Candidatus Lokiarchaeota archaeon]
MSLAKKINEKMNEDSDICPECSGQLISINESGEIVCSQCGLVVSERMVDSSHSGKRAFTAQEKKERDRTGSPISILLPSMGMTTVINKKDITNPDLKRAAKWNSRMTWQHRNLLIASTELKRISSNLNLPDHIKKEAMRLYREAFKKKLLRGRSINGMVAASIYYACRKERIPTTLQDILDETSEDPKDVRRCYRALVQEFNLKVPNTDPLSLVPKFAVSLNLDSETQNLVRKILKAYKKRIPTSGKDPKGIVAGAIYMACKAKELNFTQKDIADALGVTEVTLRSRFKELTEKAGIKIKK